MKYSLSPSNYSFNAQAKTITFTGTVPAAISNILHVANITRGVIYFQPQGGPNFTGTYTAGVLTLAASTTGHANGDNLLVMYDDGAATMAVSVPSRTPTTASVASSASSVLILAANTNRKGVSIANISTSTVDLSFSNPATAANCFMRLPAGAFILLDQQLIVTNAIYGIWASANGTAQVTEYV